MAVIETLAVQVYIQHVGGSRAPCGWILIISLDLKPNRLVYFTSPFVFMYVFIYFKCHVLPSCPFHSHFPYAALHASA